MELEKITRSVSAELDVSSLFLMKINTYSWQNSSKDMEIVLL